MTYSENKLQISSSCCLEIPLSLVKTGGFGPGAQQLMEKAYHTVQICVVDHVPAALNNCRLDCLIALCKLIACAVSISRSLSPWMSRTGQVSVPYWN